MNRRFRLNIIKGHDLFVSIDKIRLLLPRSDVAKNTHMISSEPHGICLDSAGAPAS